MHCFWKHVANQRVHTGARLENHQLGGSAVHLGKPETHTSLPVSLGPKKCYQLPTRASVYQMSREFRLDCLLLVHT